MRSIDCPVEKVLIVANRWGARLDDSVEKALESIRANPPPGIGTLEVYETRGNLGVAGSYNYILRELGPCIIACNDTRFLPGTLARCIEFIAANPEAVLHFLFAMCIFHVPQAFLDRVGYFDENFWPWGWDDIDLGYRFKKLALRTADFHGRENGIVHDHPTQSIFAADTTLRKWMVEMSNENSAHGMAKWGLRKEHLYMLHKHDQWAIDPTVMRNAGNGWRLDVGERMRRINLLRSETGIETPLVFCMAGDREEQMLQDEAGEPVVCVATIWPGNPGDRAEDFVLRELLAEHAREAWRLRLVVASAHRSGLEAARAVCGEFPAVPVEFWFLETEYAGTRPEEISFCKEELARRLAILPGWEWLYFYDADVWTQIGQVPEWMRIIGGERERCFVKIKYTLKDRLESPAHTLGAYFHHRSLLEGKEYWKVIFPKDSGGRRSGAPDCLLHDYLEGNGCRKVVPKGMQTVHFITRHDAHGFDDGVCFPIMGARDESGRWAVGKPPFSAPLVENPWMSLQELAVMELVLPRDSVVLEYGSGGSTRWLAQRVKVVHSVEHNPEWAARVARSLPPNATLHLQKAESPHHGCDAAKPGQFAAYVQTPDSLGVGFDACLVDGRARIECAIAAASWLKPDGWLFFHDWFPRERYTSRLAELLPFYELREELCVRSGQSLAVFVRRAG